ncbi:villin-2 [Gossypium australe]|uniref:Villin-2 n=1 Tax=Gossypium australe TaxID=47621 RepID=A0A5B6UJS1_9ROSI|nr:villin-2 [Gossypium australe]
MFVDLVLSVGWFLPCRYLSTIEEGILLSALKNYKQRLDWACLEIFFCNFQTSEGWILKLSFTFFA